MRKILIFSLTFFLVGLIFASPFLIKVRTECRTQYGECPSEINSSISSSGASLFSTKNKIKKLLSVNPLILDYRSQFKLPGILQIDVIIKKPVFAIHGTDVNTFGLVDVEGKILSLVDQTGLPTVEDPKETIKLGGSVSNQDLFALKLIQGIYEMYQVGSGVIENDALVVELPSQIKVLLPLSGERDLTLGTLRLVYTKVISEEQKGKYTEIDLRFKNPVIR